MVKYNNGRFIFMFEPIGGELSGVYDTNYDALYTKVHPAFIQVYGIAVEALDNEALEELREKLKDQPKFKQVIEKFFLTEVIHNVFTNQTTQVFPG